MQIRKNFFFAVIPIFMIGASVHGAPLSLADVPPNVTPDVKALIEMTFSPDPAKRGKAAKGLSALGEAAAPAVPFLIRLLSDDADTHEHYFVYRVSTGAWSALKKVGQPAVGPCIAALKDAARQERMYLIDVLGSVGSPQALDVLLPLINGADEDSSRWALDGLWNCKSPRVVAPLVELLKNNQRRSLWQSAASSLANVRDPRAVDALLAAMKEKDMNFHCRVIRSLGAQQDPRAVPTLLEAMEPRRENDFYVRWAAADALGQIRDPRAFNPLLALLKDPSAEEFLRSAAATRLGLMGDRRALPTLTAVLKDISASAMVRAAAVRTIAKLNGTESLPLLTQVVKSAHEVDQVRFWAAVEVLTIADGAIDDADLLPPLRGYYVLKESETALPHRIDLAKKALKTVISHGKNEAVRSAAAKMLKQVAEEASRY